MNTEQNTPQKPSETRSILTRIIILLGIVIGFFIYAYGWTVTEIDLERPQEAQRQENVTIALRELLSPRILQQERDVTVLSADFLMDCESGTPPAQQSFENSEAVVILSDTCADSGDELTVQVIGGEPNADARIRWMPPAEEGEDVRPRPREIIETGREELVLNGRGEFMGTIEVPLIRGGDGQIHEVQVQVAVPAGPILPSETALLVIDRMAQTIFMALVATTIAIPIAAVISFFAARNLMQRIRLSLGSMLLAFIALTIGITAGGRLLNPLGQLGLDIGRGAIGGSLGALIAFSVPPLVIVVTIVLLRQINPTPQDAKQETTRIRRTLSSLLVMLVSIFLVGALGGLGLLGAEQIAALAEIMKPEAVTNLGNGFVNVLSILVSATANLLLILGTLVELGIQVFASVVFGFTLVGIVGNVFGSALRRLPLAIGRIVGAVLGSISGAILMGLMALFGTWASLLGVLPVLVGGILGGVLVQLTLNHFLQVPTIQTIIHQRIPRMIIFYGSALFFAFLTFGWLNVGRSLVDGTLPPQTPAQFAGMTLPVPQYVFSAAVIGMVLCGLSGLVAGTKASFPFGTTLYNVSRTTLNVVRSIEPLIMGLVFVVWVGIGPFAGVLALTLHSIAALGKLYSEQIENIDAGPIEALQSTGASELQTIIYAVVPQIIPPYIAFTMYRWDINVRMSTIIGFVGGGGIGLLLQQQINLLRYRDAGVAVLAIAIVVSILDYASASIRERLT